MIAELRRGHRSSVEVSGTRAPPGASLLLGNPLNVLTAASKGALLRS
jgi:hypothetical protein